MCERAPASGCLAGKELYIFDLDGTLVDAYPAIVGSINQARRRLAYPPAEAKEIIRAVGNGNDALLRTFFSERDFPAARAAFREDHLVRLPRLVRLLPGARALLTDLREARCRLAVATNRPRETADIIITATAIAPLFDLVLCGEEVARPKPAPDILHALMERLAVPASRTAYFGDMTIDANTGRQAGVTTVIVTTGSSTRDEIEASRPDLVVDNLAAVERPAAA